MPSRQSQRVTVCGLRGAVVRDVGFKAKGRGFKSTHGCSHTVQKPSISPALFGQCTLNICLPFTIFTITIKIEFASNQRRLLFPTRGQPKTVPNRIRSDFGFDRLERLFNPMKI